MTLPIDPGEAAHQRRSAFVVGYGNTLRSDDGVGPRVAELLSADARLAGADIVARVQLTPDLAEAIAAASVVVLVDASADLAPGTIGVRRVDRGPAGATSDTGTTDMGGATGAIGAFSHHVDATALVALAGTLYGRIPPVWIVSVGVASLEFGEGLSAIVAATLPRLAETVVGIMRGDA